MILSTFGGAFRLPLLLAAILQAASHVAYSIDAKIAGLSTEVVLTAGKPAGHRNPTAAIARNLMSSPDFRGLVQCGPLS